MNVLFISFCRGFKFKSTLRFQPTEVCVFWNVAYPKNINRQVRKLADEEDHVKEVSSTVHDEIGAQERQAKWMNATAPLEPKDFIRENKEDMGHHGSPVSGIQNSRDEITFQMDNRLRYSCLTCIVLYRHMVVRLCMSTMIGSLMFPVQYHLCIQSARRNWDITPTCMRKAVDSELP